MNYRQIYARKAECEKRIKEVCPQATHESGIYCFTRVDEDGFTSMQLWRFIELYGGHIGMARPNVIEPINIYYDLEAEENA